ncbi:tetratricopeptide repeat protein [Agromyces soli]|uniref:Tetratricopeptide repeat protein n=1 Tax=Agromyces soli TaxID=659012 RepID=A0ABY4ASB3_9MICO|nr:tetratricopeptide repeat protein [Agromyces soli]UOE25297.1 tetratricopeptide repeat protein [Agromyces soli]
MTAADWQDAVDAVWADAEALGDAEVIRRIDALAAELPADDPRGAFETAGARDAAGLEDEAVAGYRRALELGLSGRARVEALIQLASTLRNLGRPGEALRLLDEAAAEPQDLGDAVVAFRALALVDLGQERRAAAELITALAPHLPQYRRSLAAYVAGLGGDASSA